jgi:hypothetical protein
MGIGGLHITMVDCTMGWPIVKAVLDDTEEAVAEFIFSEIYVHNTVFTYGGKNLWGRIVEAYLTKFVIRHAGTSPCHPRINGTAKWKTRKNTR